MKSICFTLVFLLSSLAFGRVGLVEFPVDVEKDLVEAFNNSDILKKDVWVKDLSACRVMESGDVAEYLDQYIYEYSYSDYIFSSDQLTDYIYSNSTQYFVCYEAYNEGSCILSKDNNNVRFCFTE